MFYIDPQSYSNLAMYDYELLSRMQRQDIVYCCSRKYDYREMPHVEMRPLFRYNDYRHPLLKALSYTLSMLQILWLCWMRRPRVIHVQWIRLWAVDMFVYRLIRRTTGCRIVYTAHNSLPHNAAPADRDHYLQLYRMVDHIIVHTATSRQTLMQQFGIDGSKLTVAPHGCLQPDTTQAETDACREQLLTDYPRLQHGVIFALLGVQSPYKGTDLLLRAWTESSLANNPDVTLLVAGKQTPLYQGPTTDNMVLINRRLDNCEFHTLLLMTDVLVMPYRAIDQSGLLLSAVATRTPFAVTPIGELTAPLTVGNVGWTIDNPDATSIARLLEQIAAHPETIQQRKNNTDWAQVQQLYSWDTSAQITNDIYGE